LRRYIKADLLAATEAGTDAKAAKEVATSSAAALKKEIESFAKDRDSRLKAAEKSLKVGQCRLTLSIPR
jgi:structural maintenance of chromosome 2